MEKVYDRKEPLIGVDPIVVYIVLAYSISWFCWTTALVIASRTGYFLPAQDEYVVLLESGFSNIQHILTSLIFILGGFGPLIAASLVIQFESGAAGLLKLKERILRFSIGFRWYWIAAGVAITIPGIPFLIAVLTPLGEISFLGFDTLLPFALPILLWEIMISFGEEPGWRGFLLPRLQKRFEGEKYIWMLGLIWAVWHYPYVAYHTIVSAGSGPILAMIISIVFALAGYTISLIGQTYLYVWLYNHTKSVLLSILFHGVLNFTTLLVLTAVAGSAPAINLMIALMPWVVVMALTRILGKAAFPGDKPRKVRPSI